MTDTFQKNQFAHLQSWVIPATSQNTEPLVTHRCPRSSEALALLPPGPASGMEGEICDMSRAKEEDVHVRSREANGTAPPRRPLPSK